jgi:hypothetical protein
MPLGTISQYSFHLIMILNVTLNEKSLEFLAPVVKLILFLNKRDKSMSIDYLYRDYRNLRFYAIFNNDKLKILKPGDCMTSKLYERNLFVLMFIARITKIYVYYNILMRLLQSLFSIFLIRNVNFSIEKTYISKKSLSLTVLLLLL